MFCPEASERPRTSLKEYGMCQTPSLFISSLCLPLAADEYKLTKLQICIIETKYNIGEYLVFRKNLRKILRGETKHLEKITPNFVNLSLTLE